MCPNGTMVIKNGKDENTKFDCYYTRPCHPSREVVRATYEKENFFGKEHGKNLL